ncbi:MAG: hypothetical protein CMJ89_06570 [Planctomycetes bacterium]|nr:hypothetical protein [Planctomycetota bacterium]
MLRIRFAHPPMRSTLLTTLLLLSACRTGADETSAAGFRHLFNGRDLSGWVAVNTAPSTWSVVDGMLHCSGKPTGELRTERMYQNFILELEWRHMLPGGNAGIFLWADDLTARGQPFHRSIEVQVLDHAYGNTESHTTHGDIFPIHGARMTPINGHGGSRAFPTERHSKPSPEWNHYRITCFEGTISLAVNGKLVTRGYDCSPRKGYICLESEGGIVDYRNLRIQQLPPTPIPREEIASADRGYRNLYSGVDLSGWRSAGAPGETWQVRDWILAHTGAGSHTDRSLTTSSSFEDFGFLFDVRIPPDAVPGQILLRGSPAVTISLDPSDPQYEGHFEEGWNRFEGTLIGDRMSLSLNGYPVLLHRSVGNAPSQGPWVIAPGGPLELANLFVRPL